MIVTFKFTVGLLFILIQFSLTLAKTDQNQFLVSSSAHGCEICESDIPKNCVPCYNQNSQKNETGKLQEILIKEDRKGLLLSMIKDNYILFGVLLVLVVALIIGILLCYKFCKNGGNKLHEELEVAEKTDEENPKDNNRGGKVTSATEEPLPLIKKEVVVAPITVGPILSFLQNKCLNKKNNLGNQIDIQVNVPTVSTMNNNQSAKNLIQIKTISTISIETNTNVKQ